MDGTRAGVRTSNMPYMLVTLDVSRLRDLLNAAAYCRATTRHVEASRVPGRCEGARGRCDGARSVHGVPDSTLGIARARGCARKTCRTWS